MNPNAINPWKPSPSMGNRLEQAMFDARLSQPGRDYVEACIRNGPSREVQGRNGNNTFTYFSAKTQATLKLESRRGEQAMAVLLDHDPHVIAFFAQPPRVSLDIKREDGSRATTVPYTPDFLVVSDDHIVVIETKDSVALLERQLKNEYQFSRDSHGKWHYRAAEEYFANLGMQYELKSTGDLPPALVGNLRFLEEYALDSCPPLSESEADAIRAPVLERGYVGIHELIASGVSADHVYRAIVETHVYFDLHGDSLADVSCAAVYANKATRDAMRLVQAQEVQAPPPIPGTLHLRSGGKLCIYGHEYTVLLEGERDVRLVDKFNREEVRSLAEIHALKQKGVVTGDALRTTDSTNLLADYSAEEIESAREKVEAAESGKSEKFSTRSISRFRLMTAGTLSLLDKLLILIDRKRDKGNREERISPVNSELIQKTIEEDYNTPTQQTKKSAFAKYLGRCLGVTDETQGEPPTPAREESGAPVKPVSYQTFCRYAGLYHDVKKRQGRRAAYQSGAIATSLDNSYPAHGVRPHEVCEMDHTVANLALVAPNGTDLGKAWLSVIVDSHTTHPRAFLMRFEPPSARTVLLLLRNYVMRHHRLPRVLVVDNGKEFHSHELEFFCRMFGIELRYRSPGMPRGAAMVERTFGSIDQEVFSEMEGNTRMMKEGTRLITKSVDPFRRAKWTLIAAYKAIEKYLFEVRPDRVHPALGVTPNEFEARSKEQTGHREFRMCTLDENMMLMTCPHPKRARRKVIRGRGVNVNGIYYRHVALDRVRPGKSVEVRVEPYNASVVYVKTGDRWVAATGNFSRWLGQRTHYEVEFALREEQRIMQLNAKRSGVSAKSLKHKMSPLRPENFDGRVALQQAEQCLLDQTLGMTTAMADVPTALQAKNAANGLLQQPLPEPQPGSPQSNAPPPLHAPALTTVKPTLPANEEDFDDGFSARFNLR